MFLKMKNKTYLEVEKIRTDSIINNSDNLD